MKFLKSHFALSRSQQNGIFVLVILIILLQIFLFIDFRPDSKPDVENQAEMDHFQRKLDSINKVAVVTKDKIYPFNPNYLTDFKGYQLGLEVNEIDRLLAYRAQGKWVNSAEDFQKVTEISDSMLIVIQPYFRFPDWTQKVRPSKIKIYKEKSENVLQDLNMANAEDLKKINGIGEVLSQRIIKYRLSIGGFIHASQLSDVYGLSPEVIEKINSRFSVQSRPNIVLKDINAISASELAEVPYFNYDLAQKVVTYRKLHERISSFEELIKINGFPSDKIDRIKLYLAID